MEASWISRITFILLFHLFSVLRSSKRDWQCRNDRSGSDAQQFPYPGLMVSDGLSPAMSVPTPPPPPPRRPPRRSVTFAESPPKRYKPSPEKGSIKGTPRQQSPYQNMAQARRLDTDDSDADPEPILDKAVPWAPASPTFWSEHSTDEKPEYIT